MTPSKSWEPRRTAGQDRILHNAAQGAVGPRLAVALPNAVGVERLGDAWCARALFQVGVEHLPHHRRFRGIRLQRNERIRRLRVESVAIGGLAAGPPSFFGQLPHLFRHPDGGVVRFRFRLPAFNEAEQFVELAVRFEFFPAGFVGHDKDADAVLLKLGQESNRRLLYPTADHRALCG